MAERPDHLPHVIEALSKRGIADSIIGFYVQRWNLVTRSSTAMPCPFCFFRGHSGTLVAAPEPRTDGSYVLRCGRCDGELELPALQASVIPGNVEPAADRPSR